MFHHNRLTIPLLALAACLPAVATPPFVEQDVVVLMTFEGEAPLDRFGWVANPVGDLDGDGVQEVVVTAPWRNENGTQSGKVYVYDGANGNLLASHNGNARDRLGWSAAGAGDVDADGTPDYVVGGPGLASGNPPSLGRVTVFSGADHTILIDRQGAAGSRLGSAVTGAGDVDGDGHADVFACGNFASYGAAGNGRCDLISGADGTTLWSRGGIEAGDRLGGGAGALGDVNGDGVPDLSVSAGAAGPSSGGEAYVLSGVDGAVLHTLHPSPLGTAQVFGVFFASGAGDIDGDGVTDVYVGDYSSGYQGPAGTGQAYAFSGADGSLLHRIDADQPLDGVGPGRGVGDVNGDGCGDLLVAAYTANDGGAGAGKATLYSGCDGSVLRTFTGAVAQDAMGVDALSVGDVNGDGAVDFMITAVGLDFGGLDVGRAYVVAGRP